MGATRKTDAPIQICALHSNFDAKLDTILANQGLYMAEQQRIKDIVENGLKSAVIDTQTKVDNINGRLAKIETNIGAFSWFQTWITSVRDNLFKKSLQLAMVAAVVWFILTFGKQLIVRIVG